MNGQQILNSAWPYFQRHWFKAALLALIVFVMFKKDFSMQVNMRAPERNPIQTDQPDVLSEPSKGTLTDASVHRKQAQTDRFELGLPMMRKTTKTEFINRLAHVTEQDQKDFIRRFARVASVERQKFGIPASVILAVGLINSKAGTSEVVKHSNNYFLLSCTEDWQGETYVIDGSCIRLYDVAWTSLRDHSLYLSTGKWRNKLPFGNPRPAAWAKAIEKEALYAHGHCNASQILSLIEQFELDQYDYDL